MWPGNLIVGRLRDILADGIITLEERTDFLEILNQITGGSTHITGTIGLSTSMPFDKPETIIFENSNFCLTGRFIAGSRNQCHTIIEERGGIISNSVRKSLDYLVIGTLASRDWLGTSHGKKIEKAIEYKKTNPTIQLLSEDHWIKLL